jgi:hypothetical protein
MFLEAPSYAIETNVLVFFQKHCKLYAIQTVGLKGHINYTVANHRAIKKVVKCTDSNLRTLKYKVKCTFAGLRDFTKHCKMHGVLSLGFQKPRRMHGGVSALYVYNTIKLHAFACFFVLFMFDRRDTI